MENEEMLEQTNETENTETQTAEEMVEGIELTDTTEEVEEDNETIEPEEKEEVKKFTQEEVDEIVKRRLLRKEKDFQKELSKYKDTDNVLRSTLNLSEEDDVNEKVREYYEAEGIQLPERYEPGLSQDDLEALGEKDAKYIIADGIDAMTEEANRLAAKKYANLNPREKATFNILAEKLTEEKNRKELLSIGASEELLKDESFNKFKKQFNSNVSIKDIYSLYKGSQPKPKAENPGSMKNADRTRQKDRYTEEEISKLTSKELDDPKVWEAVMNSLTS